VSPSSLLLNRMNTLPSISNDSPLFRSRMKRSMAPVLSWSMHWRLASATPSPPLARRLPVLFSSTSSTTYSLKSKSQIASGTPFAVSVSRNSFLSLGRVPETFFSSSCVWISYLSNPSTAFTTLFSGFSFLPRKSTNTFINSVHSPLLSWLVSFQPQPSP